jgi:DNA-binding MarR family transcriptional regulator
MTDELYAEVQQRMVRLIAELVLFNSAVAAKVGLAPSDSQFLTLLTTYGPMTAGELARRSGMSTGTVTGVVDRLENQGLVTRERDSADRRKVVVTPVPEAVGSRLAPHYAAQAESLRAVLRGRTASELEVISAFLADLVPGDPDR